jgi:hypothetical protein
MNLRHEIILGTLNGIGIVTALATLLGVWAGHHIVRRVEFTASSLAIPVGVAMIAGVALEIGALLSHNQEITAAAGILGATAFWDAFEFVRQGRRVQRGHAPANPHNPRHAQYLAIGNATLADLLKRRPVGHTVDISELQALSQVDRR